LRGKRGGAAIADGGDLTGVAQKGATVHGFQLRGHGEKEEGEANSKGAITQTEKTSHGLAMDGSGEELAGALG
jgi:hypothetical protein